MKTGSEPKAKPTPVKDDNKTNTLDVDPRGIFMAAVLGMSWQLAIVVLLPLIGGYELDQHFKSTPAWTAVGSVVAVCGVVAVLINTVREVNHDLPRSRSK
jgi:hypothetical protein